MIKRESVQTANTKNYKNSYKIKINDEKEKKENNRKTFHTLTKRVKKFSLFITGKMNALVNVKEKTKEI